MGAWTALAARSLASPLTGAAALVAVAFGLLSPGAASVPQRAPHVLVFTKTAGFRHDSIPAAIQAVQKLGAQNGLSVDATDDAATFTDAGLAPYAAVVFLMTTGDVLDDGEQAAFERYIRAGHGWVGVHSAADSEYDWGWYGGLVGAYFRAHPAIQSGTLDIADPRTISTAMLPARWARTDEWYDFQSNPRPSVHVLATIDESSYDGGSMGADHPIAWWHDYDGGRAWYTAGGHTIESWSEPLFLQHVLGGIEYAIGAHAATARILSLSARVHARTVSVIVRYTGCDGCSGSVRVGSVRAALVLANGTARGRTTRLPRGHARVVVVVLTGNGVRLTATRPVLVR